MDLFGDYWGLGERAGACIKIEDGEVDIEGSDDYMDWSIIRILLFLYKKKVPF